LGKGEWWEAYRKGAGLAGTGKGPEGNSFEGGVGMNEDAGVEQGYRNHLWRVQVVDVCKWV
jgi:hypothetical protein